MQRSSEHIFSSNCYSKLNVKKKIIFPTSWIRYLLCSSNSHKITSNCFWITWKLKSVHFSLLVEINKCYACAAVSHAVRLRSKPFEVLFIHFCTWWLYTFHINDLFCATSTNVWSRFPHTFLDLIIFISLFLLLLLSVFLLNRTKWNKVDSIETKVTGKIHRNCRKMWKQNQRET